MNLFNSNFTVLKMSLMAVLEAEVPEIITKFFFSLNNIEDKFFDHFELKCEKKIFFHGVPPTSLERARP